MNTMKAARGGGHADDMKGAQIDDENPEIMIQRELCLLSLVESAEIKLRRQKGQLIELERAKRADQMRAGQPSETTLPREQRDNREAIHNIVSSEQAAPSRKMAASIGWQLKSAAFVIPNELELDQQPDGLSMTKRQQLEVKQEQAIETSGRLLDEARLVAEMTNRPGEQQHHQQQQQQQHQPALLAELPMNEARRAEPILSNDNEFCSRAARRQASLRLVDMTMASAHVAELERDKDKIDGLESERRPPSMAAVGSTAAAERPVPQGQADEQTKLNHQRHNYNCQSQQHALMLQKSDQQSPQDDRANARSSECGRENSGGQRAPLPARHSAQQSSNDGRRALAQLPSTGSEQPHWQNSKHPERAHYDTNDYNVVGHRGHEQQYYRRIQEKQMQMQEGEKEEEEEGAHLESESRRRSINLQQVDDEHFGGGPTPTNDLIRTLLERDRHAFGLLTRPAGSTGSGLYHGRHRARRSSQVNNNEIELRSDKASPNESDNDESNFDKSKRPSQSPSPGRAETTLTSAKPGNTYALGASLYYQALRTSASSPSNLSAGTPTPMEPLGGGSGGGCEGACSCSAATASRQYRAPCSSKQQQQQQLMRASNEANSRLLASFLRNKQEHHQHGLDSHKQKEQQQQQQVMARCRDPMDHNKNATHLSKRHSIISVLTHTGPRTQARRSFAAFGMGVLSSSNNNNNNNKGGRAKTGRRLTSAGEMLSAHLGIRNQEPPQPMQGSAQSLDGPSAQQQPEYDPLIPESGFKIVVMGTSGSGKTSIIQRFLYGTFSARHLPTVEDTYFIEFPYKKNLINISVSDTSGTYHFPAMRKLAINSGDAFILVYSVDDPQSFDCLEQLRQTILEEREQAYLESVVAACPSDSSSSSTSSLAPLAQHPSGPAAAAGGGGGSGAPTTMMSSLTSTVMNHDKHQAHQRAEHHNHNHHYHNHHNHNRNHQHHHNQLQATPPAHDLSPGRHWSLASLFGHHNHNQHNHHNQSREQSGNNTNQQFNHHSSIGSSICSSSSCSSAENSRRSSISAAEAALRTRRTRKPPIVIVANKQDLPKDKHLVDSDEIEALAVIDWNNGFVRASAALNWNIEEIFQQVLTQARQPPTLSQAIVSKRRKSLPPKLPPHS